MKLGIDVAERTVSRLLPNRRPPPFQSWRIFLGNHVRDLVSLDFFTVPSAGLRVFFVLVCSHNRRRVVHFNVTEHPTAAWAAQQIVDAFWDETATSYLLRDRDSVYGDAFRHRLKGMGITEVLTAPHSPWQIPSRRGSSARSAASASIMSSSLASGICDASWPPTLPTITAHELTSRSTRTTQAMPGRVVAVGSSRQTGMR